MAEPKVEIYPYLRGHQIAVHIQKILVKGDRSYYNRVNFQQFFLKQLLKDKDIEHYFQPQIKEESKGKKKKND